MVVRKRLATVDLATQVHNTHETRLFKMLSVGLNFLANDIEARAQISVQSLLPFSLPLEFHGIGTDE